MVFIRTVSESEADGELAELYAACVDPTSGQVDNILKIHSISSAGLKAHIGLYKSALAGTATLRKVERELIAVVVSKINECHY